MLYRVTFGGAYADIALSSALSRSELPARDRGFVTELVYGALRRLLTLDWILDKYLREPVKRTDDRLLTVLRLGAYQLLFMDRVPGYAAIDTAVSLAGRIVGRKTTGVVNAVLRKVLRDGFGDWPSWDEPVRRISIEHSEPEWLVTELLSQLGMPGTVAFCESVNRPAPLSLRANLLKTTRQSLIESLASSGVTAKECRYAKTGVNVVEQSVPLDSVPAHRDGLCYVMDEAAMLVAPVVSPEKDGEVLDACAAPGGKSLHLAEIMGNTGRITAIDDNAMRLQMIDENCARLGVSNVDTKQMDARQMHGLTARFSHALVDAPCSGLGVLRRRPDIRWRKQKRNVSDLVKIQADILDSVGRSVKSGGVLVYSTCTILPDENQQAILAFLHRNSEFSLCDSLDGYLPGELLVDARGGTLQLWPHVHDTDGFFIARLRKD